MTYSHTLKGRVSHENTRLKPKDIYYFMFYRNNFISNNLKIIFEVVTDERKPTINNDEGNGL